MKRLLFFLLAGMLIVAFAGCHPRDSGEPLNIVIGTGDNSSETEILTPGEEDDAPPNELRLNREILENVGKPFSDILRDEPNLKPREFGCVDAGAICFTDSSKTYSYVLLLTQYLEYDEYAAEAIEKFDVICGGIYTTVGEIFPDFKEGDSPETFFDKPGVENFRMWEFYEDYGLAYGAGFAFEGMSFSVWRDGVDSPGVMTAGDIALLEIPTDNEEIINAHYNDTVYPGGIGCEEAINRAKAYRSSQGGSDCGFSIFRGGIVPVREEMVLSDENAYFVRPILDWDTDMAEKNPVYYVGFTTGEVCMWQMLSD